MAKNSYLQHSLSFSVSLIQSKRLVQIVFIPFTRAIYLFKRSQGKIWVLVLRAGSGVDQPLKFTGCGEFLEQANQCLIPRMRHQEKICSAQCDHLPTPPCALGALKISRCRHGGFVASLKLVGSRSSVQVDDEEMSELIEEMWDYIRESATRLGNKNGGLIQTAEHGPNKKMHLGQLKNRAHRL